MLFRAQNIKIALMMCIVMAVTLFFMRGFDSEIELTLIDLVPNLLTGFFGVVSVFAYLYAFPSQRKGSFFTFFIPGIVLMVLLIVSGLSSLWLIDEVMFALSFIFVGQEISKPVEKSL